MARLHSYSQHFLRSPQLVKELLGHSNIRASDTVIDIGAGSGIISDMLAERGCNVLAIEPETEAAKKLQLHLAGYENVTIIKEDFLAFALPSGQYKVFSNIPFHLSSPIVRKLTEAENPPQSIYLIVQKQFARKLVPGRDHFTAQLGTELGARYTARIRRPLERSDFTPPPGVDTVLLELILRDTPLIPVKQLTRYRAFITECYSRQKFFAQVIAQTKLFSPELRPSQLSLEQWINLFSLYKQR